MSEQNPFGITKGELLELAANKLADSLADHESLDELVRKRIEERLNIAFKTNLIGKIDAILTAEVEKLLQAEIVPVDVWGEKRGEATTIRNALHERARIFWNAKVNDKGEPADSYYGKPRHEWLFAKVVNEEFTKAIQQNISNMVGAFKVAIENDANRITKEHIEKIIKVKTS